MSAASSEGFEGPPSVRPLSFGIQGFFGLTTLPEVRKMFVEISTRVGAAYVAAWMVIAVLSTVLS